MAKASNVIKATFSRVVFLACIALTCWRAATVLLQRGHTLNPTFSINTLMAISEPKRPYWVSWLPCPIAAGLFALELAITIVVNHGHEFKWWWPSIAIFLVANIPGIWVIELDHYERVGEPGFTKWAEEGLHPVGGVALPIWLTPPVWAKLLEQTSFLALILAKWFSPRGITSHSKLSQILFTFIGIASDILDLMDNLHMPGIVKYPRVVVYAVLSCYTVSHLQFTLNYTATRKYKMRWQPDDPRLSKHTVRRRRCGYLLCCGFETELWVLVTTIVSMDGLFFMLRLYLLFGGLHLITFGNIFFITKNACVVAIDLYRIVNIAKAMRKENTKYPVEDEHEDGPIDRNQLVDLQLVVDASGKIDASAKVLQKSFYPSRKIASRKHSWQLDVSEHPTWRVFEESQIRNKRSHVLRLLYNLELAFDVTEIALARDKGTTLKCVKDVSLLAIGPPKSPSVFNIPTPDPGSIRPWDITGSSV